MRGIIAEEIAALRRHISMNVSDYSACCHLRNIMRIAIALRNDPAKMYDDELRAIDKIIEMYPSHEAMQMHRKDILSCLREIQ